MLKEILYCLREHVYHNKQNVGRNKNVEGYSDESSQGNEERVIGNWRKGDPYYAVEKTELN